MAAKDLRAQIGEIMEGMEEAKEALSNFRQLAQEYASGEYTYHVRGKPFKVQTTTESLAHSNIPRVALPKTKDDGELYEFITKENAPGHFPYTAGVFPFKRTDELSRIHDILELSAQLLNSDPFEHCEAWSDLA